MNEQYKTFTNSISQIQNIYNAIEILNWDIAVNISNGSLDQRVQEISTLTQIADSKLRDESTIYQLNRLLQNTKNLDKYQVANLRAIEKEIGNKKCLDNKLQKEFIVARTKCEMIWREAKKTSNFELVKPYFARVVCCIREIAEQRKEYFHFTNYYDALLDMHNTGNTRDIQDIFMHLKDNLPDLIHSIIKKQDQEQILIPQAIIPINIQKQIAHKIMQVMGFDFDRGRVDESEHPYCMGNATDIRITSKYYKQNLPLSMLTIMHETGHALYEQNLPVNFRNQPLGKVQGMSIHEGQSLFMEMQIGRSKAFCTFLSKLLKDEYGLGGKEYSEDNIYKWVNKVSPSLIRIDADEVTYAMHVILRYEIELLLINNEISLDELPEIWSIKMYKYLGIKPKENRVGCLQDIHWYLGHFGYFPAYTNGAVISAMLMQKFIKDGNNLEEDIIEGNFNNINCFLNKSIRNHGAMYNINELVKKSTGHSKIMPEIFTSYLKNKFLNYMDL